MVIGVTGGIGSGKSFVAQCFLQFDNTKYYHADVEAKKLMNQSTVIRKEIIKEFGEEAYKNNELNRPYISSLVFNNPEKLEKLNAIVHPAVKSHFANFVQQFTMDHLIIYENAILFEVGSDMICDVIITVTCQKNEKIKRVMARDGISAEEVEKRMNQQWSDTKKLLQSHYTILNINKEQTMLKVQDIHNILTKNQSMI